VYPVTADTAVSVAGKPSQTKVGVTAVDTGSGATVMVVVETVMPQPFCPLTVYTTVEDGVKV
jgi:hypothetical protein